MKEEYNIKRIKSLTMLKKVYLLKRYCDVIILYHGVNFPHNTKQAFKEGKIFPFPLMRRGTIRVE